MSPSWIKQLRSLRRRREEIVIGLEIGRRSVARVELRSRGEKWVQHDAATCDLAVPLFTGKANPTHGDMLADALRRVGSDLARRYVSVHVVMPDPAVAITILELDTLPPGRKAQSELARWMMKKDRFTGAEDPVCACQPLGQDGDKHLLLAAAVDAGWHRCLISALRAAEIVPWRLNAAALYAHNRWHSRLLSAGTGGALVRLDSDSWTISVWDKRAVLRLVRSRWREPSKAELELISADVERTILGYIHGGATREVKVIYASAGLSELASLAAALNARLTTPCVAFVPDEGVAARGKTGDRMAPAALVAAMA